MLVAVRTKDVRDILPEVAENKGVEDAEESPIYVIGIVSPNYDPIPDPAPSIVIELVFNSLNVSFKYFPILIIITLGTSFYTKALL